MDFAAVAELCAPGVAVEHLRSIASVESSFNPFAIGVVGGHLQRQPRDLAEGVATAKMLAAQGFDYSIGLVQINQKNFVRYGLTTESAFDPCANLRVGSLIFLDCYKRAGVSNNTLGDALSCYYSGDFKTGYRVGYVDKVLSAGSNDLSATAPAPIPAIGQSRPSKVRRAPPRSSSTEPLFVTSTIAPGYAAAPAPSGSRETALLF